MLLFPQDEYHIARVSEHDLMLVGHLLDHDHVFVGRTFLFVHLLNFTIGLRLETLSCPPQLLHAAASAVSVVPF